MCLWRHVHQLHAHVATQFRLNYAGSVLRNSRYGELHFSCDARTEAR